MTHVFLSSLPTSFPPIAYQPLLMNPTFLKVISPDQIDHFSLLPIYFYFVSISPSTHLPQRSSVVPHNSLPLFRSLNYLNLSSTWQDPLMMESTNSISFSTKKATVLRIKNKADVVIAELIAPVNLLSMFIPLWTLRRLDAQNNHTGNLPLLPLLSVLQQPKPATQFRLVVLNLVFNVMKMNRSSIDRINVSFVRKPSLREVCVTICHFLFPCESFLTLNPLYRIKKGNLNKHITSVHLKEKTKICPEPGCGKSFSFRDGLVRHIAHVHKNERAHVCLLCQRAFKQASHLQKHLKSIHKAQ